MDKPVSAAGPQRGPGVLGTEQAQEPGPWCWAAASTAPPLAPAGWPWGPEKGQREGPEAHALGPAVPSSGGKWACTPASPLWAFPGLPTPAQPQPTAQIPKRGACGLGIPQNRADLEIGFSFLFMYGRHGPKGRSRC